MMETQKKILIVDDEIINLDFFDVMLSKLGFSVAKAEDGIEAFEKMKHFYPDLILLDNVMPRMSGWELTRMLKNDPKYMDIPVIMLSALDDVRDRIEGFELGIDDYITKPFNFTEVLARIRAVLRNRDLYARIAVQESHLSLAEELNTDMKRTFIELIESIDDLDGVIEKMDAEDGDFPDIPKLKKNLKELFGKSKRVRKQMVELDARLEKTISEWEYLKRDDKGFFMEKKYDKKNPAGE